jgi:hypothetical protein
MNLEQLVNEQLTTAMKNKDKTKLDVLRAIKKSIIEFNTSGSGKVLDEDESIKLLNQQAKMRRESIEMFTNGGRLELAEKEKEELEVIIGFLPKQLSEDEVKEIALKVKLDTNASTMADMGKLMGAVMKEVSGKADGKVVQSIVKEILT